MVAGQTTLPEVVRCGAASLTVRCPFGVKLRLGRLPEKESAYPPKGDVTHCFRRRGASEVQLLPRRAVIGGYSRCKNWSFHWSISRTVLQVSAAASGDAA